MNVLNTPIYGMHSYNRYSRMSVPLPNGRTERYTIAGDADTGTPPRRLGSCASRKKRSVVCMFVILAQAPEELVITRRLEASEIRRRARIVARDNMAIGAPSVP